jgi:erythromycin esterase
MSVVTLPTEVGQIRSLARPLQSAADLTPLLDRVGDARFVLIGEASHGTSEFYRWRAELTKRLVAEHGFDFVAVEGDWPDCFQVNCWLKDRTGTDEDARTVLQRFDRWPTWMWANTEVAEFLDWLRAHNRQSGGHVGFYGLDVYSLWESLDRVLRYLQEHDPSSLASAQEAVACFEPYGRDPQRYAAATRLIPETCESDVVRLLADMRRLLRRDTTTEADFDALQNTEVLAEAERYYRAMVRGGAESWNVRDCHMVDTLDRLVDHHGPNAKAIVWAHNTHVGDARATDMADVGMLNVGQVVRQRHRGDGVVLVGFASHHGSVIAAPRWGSTARQMEMPPAPPHSHEALLHAAVDEMPSLLVFPRDGDGEWLRARRGHRAVGVVYDPDRDRYGNWVPTVIGQRYDSLIHLDATTALHPLHAVAHGQERETYPWST